MLCILNVGTVPTLCILYVGTVPMLCILNVGTVPTFSHSLLGMHSRFGSACGSACKMAEPLRGKLRKQYTVELCKS